MTTNVRREFLGETVLDRRQDLRLSKEEAARRGGMSVKTWTAVEDGKPVRPTTYTGVEDALQWKRGSVSAVLDGGDATPLETEAEDEPIEVEYAARVLELVRAQYGEEVYRAAVARLDEGRAGSDTTRRGAS
jgi:transcriptional regulator with XRE-family HTH domain